MPKFQSKEEAHRAHEHYNIDTELEGKYNLFDIYNIQKNRLNYLLENTPEYSQVLEVGCNSGGLLRIISSERKCYCNGVDLSAELVQKARSKGFHCKVAPAEELPYESEKFDVVVMTEVMEHLYDPKESLKEISRVLKKGGLFIGSVPHKNSENSQKRSVEAHDWHCHIFDNKSLKKLLTKFFDDVEVEDICWYNDLEESPQWIGFKARKP
jgi:SAM-dependent methyltransferase